MSWKRGRLSICLLGLLAGLGLAVACLYAYAGLYGINVLIRRGGSLWISVQPDDARLSASIRLALQQPVPPAVAGVFQWQTIERGLDVAELPVIASGREVDRILLARLDPAAFRFVVRTAPAGNRDLNAWLEELGATLVINGSYYARGGGPDTPLLSAGVALGPRQYQASHGAFVASPSFVGITDLARQDWRIVFQGADDAMVSYPLLLATDGWSRVQADPRWLANRTFIGQDRSGRMVIGTTVDAFFSLDRFARFLREAPLDLAIALNLDGGPVACQGIVAKGFRRDFCGKWELATQRDEVKLLTSVYGQRRWALPIVLAALRK